MRLPPITLTYRLVMSCAGVTWCGVRPTANRSTTVRVTGSITATSPPVSCGTYTRGGRSARPSGTEPMIAAHTLTGAESPGRDARRDPLGGGQACTFNHGAELGPGNARRHVARTDRRSEAAVGAGDDALRPDHVHEVPQPFRDQLRVLDIVRARIDH